MGLNARRGVAVLLLGLWIFLLVPQFAYADGSGPSIYPSGDITQIEEGTSPTAPNHKPADPSWWERLWKQVGSVLKGTWNFVVEKVGNLFTATGKFASEKWQDFQQWWANLPNWAKGLFVGIIAVIAIIVVVAIVIVAGIALSALAIVAIAGAIIGVVAGGLWYGFTETGEFSILKAVLWVVGGGVVGAGAAVLLWKLIPVLPTAFRFIGQATRFIGRSFTLGWRSTKFLTLLKGALKSGFFSTVLGMGKDLLAGQLRKPEEYIALFLISTVLSGVGRLVLSGIAAQMTNRWADRLYSKNFLIGSLERAVRFVKNLRLKAMGWPWFLRLYQSKSFLGSVLRRITAVFLYNSPTKITKRIAKFLSDLFVKKGVFRVIKSALLPLVTNTIARKIAEKLTQFLGSVNRWMRDLFVKG